MRDGGPVLTETKSTKNLRIQHNELHGGLHGIAGDTQGEDPQKSEIEMPTIGEWWLRRPHRLRALVPHLPSPRTHTLAPALVLDAQQKASCCA